jgi:hypothetical protein
MGAFQESISQPIATRRASRAAWAFCGMAKTDRSRHLREIASAYLERVVSH